MPDKHDLDHPVNSSNELFLQTFKKKQVQKGYIPAFRMYTSKKGYGVKKINTITVVFGILATSMAFFSCNKTADDAQGPYNLSYGDSILYLKPVAGDYIVHPSSHRDGVYTGFPDGIEIDDVTGAINVSKSETGLRYRITHTAPDGTVTTTKVVLSGITFTDHYYHLSTGDSVALPVYNASAARALPLNGSVFDEGNTASTGGCDVRTTNGQINLAQTVRNGVFGAVPKNDERRDFDIDYRLNDESGKSKNTLRVRLYYYETMADVPADLLQTLQDREELGVFLRNGTTNISSSAERVEKEARPRPPCVIIIAN